MKRLILVAALLAAHGPRAHAGGLYLPTRGVRPTARAGAFVAGADDLGALWFNPAGLAAATGGKKNQFIFDLSFVSQSVSYQRVDSGFNEYDAVDNESAGLPIPTVGVSVDVGDDLVVGGGIFAPYASLGRYPVDGPQRYSLVDLSETKMVVAEVAVGWQMNDKLRLGAGLQNLFSAVSSTVVFNGCPGQTVCAPEDPEFDSLSSIDQRDYFSPSGVVGAQYEVTPKARVGAAVQLPFRVSGKGDLGVVLPSSGFFNGATVNGDTASMSFTLPAMIRAGVEVQPAAGWRLEVAVDYEMWSMHDEFSVEPDDVYIEGAPGVGTYQIGDMKIPRNFEDTIAFQLGVERKGTPSSPLTVAAGYAYETSATPDEYLSVMTVDGSKHLVGGGLGYRFGATNLFVSAAYVAVADREVSPDTGEAPQLSPIRDEGPAALPTYVNWGTYQAHWLTVGAGVVSEF